MSTTAVRRWCVLAVAAVAAGVASGVAAAQSGDTIEGAVWKFEMTSKARKGETRVGRFRVNNDVLYQKPGPKTPDAEDHVVGKNHPEFKKTTIKFDGLRTFAPPPDKHVLGPVSGKARLAMDERGEWSGQFVDSGGVRWDFKCVRIKE